MLQAIVDLIGNDSNPACYVCYVDSGALTCRHLCAPSRSPWSIPPRSVNALMPPALAGVRRKVGITLRAEATVGGSVCSERIEGDTQRARKLSNVSRVRPISPLFRRKVAGENHSWGREYLYCSGSTQNAKAARDTPLLRQRRRRKGRTILSRVRQICCLRWVSKLNTGVLLRNEFPRPPNRLSRATILE